MEVRVAHIIGGLSVGGAERNLVNLLNALSCEYRAAIFPGAVRSGHTFHDDLDPAVEQLFVPIRRRSMPLGVLRLAKILREKKINVVHTHMFASNLYGALAAKLAGVPVVVTSEHGENPWKGPFGRWIERSVISPLVDMRFCVSPRILALRRDRDGVPAAKLRLTVNGTVVPAKRSRRTRDSVPTIGAVGRFIPAKDYPRLLEAVAELVNRGYSLNLLLLGDGPEMSNVQKLVEDLQLQNVVQLPGMVADVGSWYDRFDIYVSSSIREGQPVALLEGMAHGLPVVATNVGASADTVRHNEGGLIVPPSDTQSLADALARLLDDAKLRETLGRQARARVEKEYSVEAVAEYHRRFYCELLAKKRNTQSGVRTKARS